MPPVGENQATPADHAGGRHEVRPAFAPLNPNWPTLRGFEGDHLRRVQVGLGGIGTGSFAISGRGHPCQFELMNRPSDGHRHLGLWGACCFILRTQTEGAPPTARCLEGEADTVEMDGPNGAVIPHGGLPKFQHARFDAAYPLTQVRLSDPDVPLRVRLEAFNPMIPGNADDSGIPITVLRYVLDNPFDQPVDTMVCGTWRNFIGCDGVVPILKDADNINQFRASQDFSGIAMSSDGVDPRSTGWGTMALATTETDDLTYRTNWLNDGWQAEWIDFWDDLLEDGALSQREQLKHCDQPIGSLAPRVTVPPGESKAVTFLVSWHFPNRVTWSPKKEGAQPGISDTGPNG
ncbi:MAG: GH116 family glycosyl-hydrolase, partial [bacterium]